MSDQFLLASLSNYAKLYDVIVTEDPIEIIDVKDGQVKVRAIRLMMCAHCHLQILPSELQPLEVWVDDRTGAQPNELVQLGMSSRHFLLTVALVFGLPLLGLWGGTLSAFIPYPHFPHSLVPLLGEICLASLVWAYPCLVCEDLTVMP